MQQILKQNNISKSDLKINQNFYSDKKYNELKILSIKDIFYNESYQDDQ